MKILLVEADRSKIRGHQKHFAPLGLQKIATYHLNKGDVVSFSRGFKRPKMTDPDLIYITTLFTFEWEGAIKTILLYKKHYGADKIRVGGVFATLFADLIKKETGITPHIGLLDHVEHQIPNRSLFDGYGFRQLTFTSRGCPRKCKFCMVNIHEPKYFDKPNWYKEIPKDADKIYFGDNNFLAKSIDQIERDAGIIRSFNIPVDFNQALDVRLLTEEKAELLRGIKFDPFRIAYDNESYKDHVIEAVRIKNKYELKGQIRALMLYNFNDTPEEIYERMKTLVDINVSAFPMRYKDIYNIKKNCIGKHWTDKTLKNFLYLVQGLGGFQGMMVVANKPEKFRKFFGEDAQEFKKLLHLDNVHDYIKNTLAKYNTDKEREGGG